METTRLKGVVPPPNRKQGGGCILQKSVNKSAVFISFWGGEGGEIIAATDVRHFEVVICLAESRCYLVLCFLFNMGFEALHDELSMCLVCASASWTQWYLLFFLLENMDVVYLNGGNACLVVQGSPLSSQFFFSSFLRRTVK